MQQRLDRTIPLQRHMPATRAEGSSRLARFAPLAGSNYAHYRNYDWGPEDRTNVSVLSPYIRHRLITEAEVIRAVLERQSYASAEKFLQEVCWRSYWKGWLEARPQVWAQYLAERDAAAARYAADADLAGQLQAAKDGVTGIEPFDAWARELIETGYLHNHARMWFASIWIFTLRLPWALGADHFFRNLLDGDPASNTLSWRWVAGAQTLGKAYVATAHNIERFTSGRFAIHASQLAPGAHLDGHAPHPAAQAIPRADRLPPDTPVALLITEEDLSPELWGLSPRQVRAIAGIDPALGCNDYAAGVLRFKRAALDDALRRASDHFGCEATRFGGQDGFAALDVWTAAQAPLPIATRYAPVGPTAEWLGSLAPRLTANSQRLLRLRAGWDDVVWPHATKGFFALKEQIPAILRERRAFL